MRQHWQEEEEVKCEDLIRGKDSWHAWGDLGSYYSSNYGKSHYCHCYYYTKSHYCRLLQDNKHSFLLTSVFSSKHIAYIDVEIEDRILAF